MIGNLLTSCGLNKTERDVLLCLIERGASIASILAKQLNIKRPTVYAALEQLTRLDLVTKKKQESVTYFYPTSADLMPEILKQRAKIKFEEVEDAANLLKKALKQRQQPQPYKFKNVTFESIEAVYAQLEDSLMGGDFLAIFNPQKAVYNTASERIVSHFLKESAKTHPSIKEIAVSGPVTDWYKSKIHNPNHHLKEIGEDEQVITDMILLNGSVILLDYDPNQKVAIKITHDNYYKSMTAVFNMLWARL